MAKRGSSKPAKVGTKRITGKQRVARIRNIAVARKSRKKGFGSGAKVTKSDRTKLAKIAGNEFMKTMKKNPNIKTLGGVAKVNPRYKAAMKAQMSGKW